ncbi:MAG: hypothetical protein EOO36_16790 [Cytophagaceae bacterium]|nr:MAG: hypothetical protein EOO36_16790 [Cytophagaceae bacterium]
MTGILALVLFAARAQVANDNIENRRLLRAEEIITSTTTGCTVQRGCVDERLTGKCIEYHNDQWFEFRPPATGMYYVNIGGQHCRDVRGVQLVVLTGTPCEPATYRVLSCTSLGTQDDLFVALPNLQAGQPYLLDVDGYLKDFCGFKLQVSRQARGVPAVLAPAVPATIPATSRIIELAWEVPDSLATALYCRVLRREQHQFRAVEIRREPITRDTYGQRRATYALTDTLPGVGQYIYQIMAESDDPATPPTILKQLGVAYSQLRPSMPGTVAAGAAFLDLPLTNYPRNAYLTFIVTNPQNGNRLRTVSLTNQAAEARKARLYAQPWLDAGLRQVAVDVTCRPAHGLAYTDHLLLPLSAPAY